MKLLTKQEITNKKATERKVEIDEGIKLARKVDGLRQIVSEEEKSLARFRSESLSHMRAEIKPLVEEKESLSEEIEKLKQQRNLLRAPLDKEWSEVRSHQARLVAQEESLDEKISKLQMSEEHINEKVRQLVLEEERIEDARASANESIEDAEAFKKQAIEELADARNEAQVLAMNYELKAQELLDREGRIAARERDAHNFDRKNSAEERRLREWNIALNDKYQTLLRTQKELRK